MAAITENLSHRWLHVNNSCGAVKVHQHSLLPNLRESLGLNVHVVKQSWGSSSSHLDSQLAIASANAHRGLKAYSSWLENLGRGHQERRTCWESPNALLPWLWVLTGNSLQFFWTFAPESLWMLLGSMQSITGRCWQCSHRTGRKVNCRQYVPVRVSVSHFART